MMHVDPSAVYLPGLRLQGWAASLLLHAAVGGAAIWTMSDLTLIPKEEPFRWDVSIVRAATGEPAAAPASPSPAASVFQPTAAPPVETQPPVVEPPPPAPHEAQVEPEPVRTAAIERSAPPPVPAQEPVPPTPREIVRHEMAYPAQEDVPQQIVAKAVTQTMPAESPIEAATGTRTIPSNQPAQVASSPASAVQGPKADYGWLAKSMWERVMELKRYPPRARLNQWEGKVVLAAVIGDDGHLVNVVVKESSGYELLDEAAVELIRQATPLALAQPLGRSQVIVQIPITYALAQR